VIDRTGASRLGVRIQDIDNALNDAFAQLIRESKAGEEVR
jgi:multidrug efflux pump subunit AcrB